MNALTRRGLRHMAPRDPHEPHRVASSLELFFDLVFVVAVSMSSGQLHVSEADAAIASGVGSYLMVFFAVWWAWVNFSWFASAFDTDDWLYRVLTIVQMGGALVLAAGTRAAMADHDFLVITIGYVIMRAAMVVQWLRVARGDAAVRSTAHRYAIGITLVQLLWVGRLALPDQGGVASFLVLVVLEISIPLVAEAKGRTSWHPHHIAERYSLFTLVVLGESILASANAIVNAAEEREALGPLLVLAASGLVLAAGMWWIYFARSYHAQLASFGAAFRFGYGHYVVFAAAGAFSAGINVAVEHDTHGSDLDAAVAAATLTVPVGLFVLAIWALALRPQLPRRANFAVPALAVGLGATALLPNSIPLAASVIVAIVVVLEVSARSESAQPGGGGAPVVAVR